MMVPVRSNDVRDDLADGIDAAPMPARAPDGGLAFTPAAPLEQAPPRLCEYGPCRHYHTMTVQMNAANPRAERIRGRLVQHAKTFATEVHHYCYPDVGIETVLGSLPVLKCNRWDPIVPEATMPARVQRAADQYKADLAAFEAAREAEARAAAEAAGELAPPMKIIMTFAREADGVMAPFHAEVEVDPDTTIRELVVMGARATPFQIETEKYHVEIGSTEPLGNLDATILELGLEANTEVVVILSPKKDTK